MALRPLSVWVVSPEVHQRGGTERCVAEQLERWRGLLDVRLYSMKGVEVALDALREVPSDVILAVAGPVDRAVVLGWAFARGVGDRVQIWPHIADVSDYYTASDVVIAPSREDAFSLPPLEAMAAGVPVIS
jgi:glycosyltransferase involved in cell wall biosynthesis